MLRDKKLLAFSFVIAALLIVVFGIKITLADYMDKTTTSNTTNISPFEELGEQLRDSTSSDEARKNVCVVNGTNISVFEWKYFSAFDIGRAKNFNLKTPTSEGIFEEIINRKIIVAEARKSNLYPSNQEIDDYVAEQRQLNNQISDLTDIDYLLKGWGISEEQYYAYMRNIWADSIAIEKWNSKYIIPELTKDKDYYDSMKEYNEKLELFLTDAKSKSVITITPDGTHLNLKIPSNFPNSNDEA